MDHICAFSYLYKYIFCIHCVGLLFVYVFGSEGIYVDVKAIQMTGPGLIPEKIVLPARYFFITLYNNKLIRYDPSLASDLKVEVNGRNNHNRECRVWVNVLDRRDGSYIARYKLYETCYSVQITVKFKGDHVGGSPFNIKKPIQPEDCYCPQPLDKWLEYNDCPSNFAQIDKDLQVFPAINFTTFRQHVIQKVDKSGSMSVCNFVISNNEIYRKCYGEHVGFKMFVDSVLLSLARKVRLPDTEMFVNLGDWPLAKRDADKLFPMFSWCGSRSTLDIVLPTYDLTESSLEMMARVSLDMLSVQGNLDRPWEEKEPKAFWRGRDSSRERLKLMEIAKEHPDLFNVSMTNYFFFRDQEKIHGKSKHISFFKFFEYKYQVCLDGTVAAYRLPYLLAGDALVMKQDSDYYEYFYSELKPWVHFVPVKRDLSDLVEKVRWAREHDEEARRIVQSGQEYARNNLLPQNVLCYHTVLLKEWSRRIVSEVNPREGMEKVSQPESSNHCVCPSVHDEL